MPDIETEIKERENQIATNEGERQTMSQVRVSTWAILIGVIVCGAIVAFMAMMQR